LPVEPEDGVLCTVGEAGRTTYQTIPVNKEWLAKRSAIQRAEVGDGVLDGWECTLLGVLRGSGQWNRQRRE
jgi:hypothetical protein